MPHKVKEVADLAQVSVRTLHHYDQIGLLKPAQATEAGYRLYTEDDLGRLQQILFFKELGFSLQEIREMLDTPGFDRREALISQKRLLIEKKTRLEAIIDLVDKTLATIEGGDTMAKKEMFEAFDMSEIEKHQKEYAEETRQKYGHTDAYKESQRRAAAYTKDDWARIKAKTDAIYKTLADSMDKGPADPLVQQAISDWRELISDNFYECNLEIFRGLGDLYVQDERFTANIDKVKPGLARFMQQAMGHYCDSQVK
ncbi:MerR family transcriptional regulator [Heliobacterium undosum]|uniref:MerR family transcriptional regulator n=1 Tax=Heliomicrobium undosum TaxID=121734 RepID=A0A845L6W6_9FIRM|nr:MerR family transcriptional regulator [Heliomicrobium undosum]MZP31009.1 MerR family transcriptional regulator [Heliomicrobium undosum]